ncbi:MAG: amidohydrolase family protein, partial [Clostridiales bacterium]|nr:amidohydrolase family protein [Clostridiales bacterium]
MIIDIHTHTFPPAIAGRVMDKLSKSSNMHYYIEGTVDALHESMIKNGIDCSVLMPIATNAGQYPTINRVAGEINQSWQETGILSFGSLHPDNDNYKEILHDLKERGFIGIKLHPVFQEVYIDDPRFVRIIDYAAELGFIILIHAGYDISFPGVDVASPQHIHNLLKQLVPDRLILAHMGGWGDWDYVEEHLLGYPIYLDCSFSLIEPRRVGEWPGGKA